MLMVVLLQALEKSRSSRHQPKFLSIYESIIGIIFLGTPHRGSTDAPWGLLVLNLAKFALQDANNKVLRGLTPDSEMLEQLRETFGKILEDGKFEIHSFYETRGPKGLHGLHGEVGFYLDSF
jgi:hypothetical protein